MNRIYEDIRKYGQPLLEYNDKKFERFIYNPSKYRGISFEIKREHIIFIQMLDFSNIDFSFEIID